MESAAREIAGPRESLARRLLARYVPDGPDESASADHWRGWWQENERYLFFADAAGIAGSSLSQLISSATL